MIGVWTSGGSDECMEVVDLGAGVDTPLRVEFFKRMVGGAADTFIAEVVDSCGGLDLGSWANFLDHHELRYRHDAGCRIRTEMRPPPIAFTPNHFLRGRAREAADAVVWAAWAASRVAECHCWRRVEA